MHWRYSETDCKITSSESLLQIYLTTQQVMLVFISKLTLGASRTHPAQALLLAADVILSTLTRHASSRFLAYKVYSWFHVPAGVPAQPAPSLLQTTPHQSLKQV